MEQSPLLYGKLGKFAIPIVRIFTQARYSVESKE